MLCHRRSRALSRGDTDGSAGDREGGLEESATIDLAPRCDGKDNDCNDFCDDGDDGDGDGVTHCGTVIESFDNYSECVDDGPPDCDDEDGRRYPGADEVCDGVDNDCNEICDDWDSDLIDEDRDGYTVCGSVPDSVADPTTGECEIYDFMEDCEPMNEHVHPGQQEICDGVDQNCDDELDPEESPCVVSDGVGEGCFQGSRVVCHPGGVLDDTCEANSPVRIDPDFCENYELCEHPDDAAVCLLDGEGLTVEQDEICRTRLVVSEGFDGVLRAEPCARDRVRVQAPVAFDANSVCRYTIIGGQFQQGYNVLLVEPAFISNPGISVGSCRVDLRVIPEEGAGNARIAINLAVGGELGQPAEMHVIGVDLRNDIVDTCGTMSGLQCETWLQSAEVLLPTM